VRPPRSPNDRELLQAVARRSGRWRLGTWYWGDAILVDGLLEAVALGVGAPAPLIEDLQRWAHSAPPSFDDALAPGRAIFALVEEGTIDEAVADRVRTALARLAPLRDSIPALEPHRPQFRFGVCIDALYHLPTSLLAAERFDGQGGSQRALQVAEEILRALRCEGGWAQWYDVALDRNNGVVWSRGLGWALLGLLDLLELTGWRQGRDELERVAAEIFALLARTQRPSGHWPAVLHEARAPEESSTAAFFVAGALHPRAPGLAGELAAQIEAAAAAVRGSITAAGIYGGVSGDVLPSWRRSDYLKFSTVPSPWGQGVALRALAALVRSGANRQRAGAQPDDP
jgi:hypothetical protein